jgi:hypothetical protein
MIYMQYSHFESPSLYWFKVGFLGSGKVVDPFFSDVEIDPKQLSNCAPSFIEYGEDIGGWTAPYNMKFVCFEAQPHTDTYDLIAAFAAHFASGTGFLITSYGYAVYWADPGLNSWLEDVQDKQEEGDVADNYIVWSADDTEWEYDPVNEWWEPPDSQPIQATYDPDQLSPCTTDYAPGNAISWATLTDYADNTTLKLGLLFTDLGVCRRKVFGGWRHFLPGVVAKLTGGGWLFTNGGTSFPTYDDFMLYSSQTCILNYGAGYLTFRDGNNYYSSYTASQAGIQYLIAGFVFETFVPTINPEEVGGPLVGLLPLFLRSPYDRICSERWHMPLH